MAADGQGNILSLAPGIGTAAVNYSAVILNSKASDDLGALDLWQGHQYCFVVTLGQVLPGIFVVIVAFYLAIGLLKLPFVILSAGTQLVSQMVSYTHADGV
jgi:hypothetical protein